MISLSRVLLVAMLLLFAPSAKSQPQIPIYWPDWYVITADTNPTQFYSTKRGIWVTGADATYVAWLAAGFTPVSLPTAAQMYLAIDQGRAETTASKPWIPVLTFDTTAGIAYLTQVGSYYRTGPLIIANFKIELTSKGSSTGAAGITGLPSAVTVVGGSVIVSYYNGMSGLGVISGYVSPSTTNVALSSGSATVSAPMTDANFTNSSVLAGTIIYFVN